MVFRSTMDVPTRYQWDVDSRFPLPDPGTAPGNCGITCATVAEQFYTDTFHGIYANRRLVTSSVELSSTIGDQSRILWERGVPNAIAKINLAGLHSLMKSQRRPIVLGLNFAEVPFLVAGHPFRGSHSIMLRANAGGGFTYLDPNFNRTYRRDPFNGYRFMPDAVLTDAYYNVPTQWAIVPTKDKLLPSLPDTGTAKPLRADGDPFPMRYTNLIEGGKTHDRTLKAGKPIRSGPTVSSSTLNTPAARVVIHAWGRIEKEDLPAAEQKFGPVLLFNAGRQVGYVKAIDLVD